MLQFIGEKQKQLSVVKCTVTFIGAILNQLGLLVIMSFGLAWIEKIKHEKCEYSPIIKNKHNLVHKNKHFYF